MAVAPFFHWYAGVVPPLVGVAVKVTVFPAQTGFEDTAIATLTGRDGFTVIVIADEVAGLPEVQVSPDVSVTVITSPFAGA